MLARLHTYASFVRFSHSVFALPFALTGALLAFRLVPFGWMRVLWIVACMVAARSAAMGFNRLVDASFDARNPRTAMRELPQGRMSRREATLFVVVSSIAFVAVRRPSSARRVCGCRPSRWPSCSGTRWPSATRRTRSSISAWRWPSRRSAAGLRPAGRCGWDPWLLGLAIGSWVAGFDVLYACQDVEFDRREGLRSIPVRFGVPAVALWISRGLHVVTVAALAALGVLSGLGPIYARRRRCRRGAARLRAVARHALTTCRRSSARST